MIKRRTPVTVFVVMMLSIVAAVLFGVLGTLDHFSEGARRRAELRTDAVILADQLEESLTLPVWNFDIPQLEKILDSTMQDEEVRGVTVSVANVSAPGGKVVYGRTRDEAWKTVTTDQPSAEADAFFEERPIKAHGETLGTVRLWETPQFVNADMRTRLGYLVFIFLSFGTVLTVSLYLLLWWTVLRPLHTVEQYALEVSSGRDGPLVIGGGQFRGELESLRSSIRKMVELLASRYAEPLSAERRIESQLRFEELLARVSSSLAEAFPENMAALEAGALKDIAEALGSDRIVLAEVDEKSGDLVMRSNYRRGGPPFPEALLVGERYPYLWKVLRSGEEWCVPDTAALEGEAAVDRKHLQEIGIKSQIAVPMICEGRMRFALVLANVAKAVDVPREMIPRLRVIADVIGNAILRCEAQVAAHAYLRRIERLATELTRAEERQRRELAAILHDGVGQNLFAVTTQLVAMRNRLNGAEPGVDKALALVDQITRDTRELTFELCPPVLYQLGLGQALQRLAEQFSSRHSIACALSGTATGPLDLNARGLIYHVIRELLTNVAKHSGARRVTIELTEDDKQVRVKLCDDGRGFDPRTVSAGRGGFGLFHLRERVELLGGKLRIESAPLQGCQVEVELPLEAAPVE